MKKGDTPMECDLKGLFKITVEETKLKEKYTISSIWKKSFRHLYYQFQFRFFFGFVSCQIFKCTVHFIVFE